MNYPLKRINEFLETLSFPARTDCPVCNGKNTFSAEIVEGHILFYCYRASCHLKGKKKYGISINSIRSGIYMAGSNAPTMWSVPNYFSSPLNNNDCRRFMQYWGIINDYIEANYLAYYDPKLNRCVFILKDEKGEIKGATGRSLSRNNLPKWYIYHRPDGDVFRCSRTKNVDTDSAFLVEDCISAVRVSSIACGISILGTNFNGSYVRAFRPYKTVFICLDDDATGKSLKIQKELAPFVEARIIPIKKDIKYFSEKELKELCK